MASRFDSPAQRLAIVSTAAVALLAVLASSPPRCPMSVTSGDEFVLATGTGSYERHFALESSADAVGVVSVFLESAGVARVLVHIIADRAPDGGSPASATPVAVEIAPGVRHEVAFSSFLEGVNVRVELQTGGEVALDVAVTAGQDDCHDNAFVTVADG